MITDKERGKNELQGFFDQLAMPALFTCMALAIVAFNVMGYKKLFNEPDLLFGITPFGVLIGFAELAALIWTSRVIKNWPTVSPVLKYSIIPVMLGFWLLSFIGINSYLKNSAYNEQKLLNSAKIQYENNDVQLQAIDKQIAVVQAELNAAREDLVHNNNQIYQLQIEASQISGKMSDRRKGSLVCDKNVDCAAAVSDFKLQKNNIEHQIGLLQDSAAKKQKLISAYEAELVELNKRKRELSNQNHDNINHHAQSESASSIKKQTYENIVIAIYGLFGFGKPDDPFAVFIGFISFIIYPVYFMLNLYTCLDSEANREVRETRNKSRMTDALRRAERKAEIKAEKESDRKEKRQIQRSIAREKRALAHKKAQDKIKSYSPWRGKLLKYLRIWAHRRKKTRNIEVIKNVETVVEVEKIIEKPVEVIVEKEVQIKVEVERIVQVEKEVPVYIDRVQTVMHEVIIPVPEGIRAEELDKYLHPLSPLHKASEN